ncbi:hypothetical protein KIPB_006087, partial [Kipferlia bialata]|eukprot:g6087.t1
MTAVQAAGFSSRGRPGTGRMGRSAGYATQSRLPRDAVSSSPKIKARALERQIHQCMEDAACSCALGTTEAHQKALKRIRQGIQLETKLRSLMETHDLDVSETLASTDLRYTLQFHRGICQTRAGLISEALATYGNLLTAQSRSNGNGTPTEGLDPERTSEIRVNVGALHYKQERYQDAIKYWRMALDQIPRARETLRVRISLNIVKALILLERWQDAVSVLEDLAEVTQEFSVLYSLVICYYALEDQRLMHQAFTRLVKALNEADASIANAHSIGMDDNALNLSINLDGEVDEGANQADDLGRHLSTILQSNARGVLLVARLIAPSISYSISSGYDRVVSVLRTYGKGDLAIRLEMGKALAQLRKLDFKQAVETLHGFDKVGINQVTRRFVYTNLAYTEYVAGNTQEAISHADKALDLDNLNVPALLIKDTFLRAVEVDQDSLEAKYNLALCYFDQSRYQDALSIFAGLAQRLPRSAEVLFLLGECYAHTDRPTDAIDSLSRALSVSSHDPGLYMRLGQLYAASGQETRALHSYRESDRLNSGNVQVLSWLAAHCVRRGNTPNALQYIDRLIEIEGSFNPRYHETKALLLSRAGQGVQALSILRDVLSRWPNRPDTRERAIKIGTELNLPVDDLRA